MDILHVFEMDAKDIDHQLLAVLQAIPGGCPFNDTGQMIVVDVVDVRKKMMDYIQVGRAGQRTQCLVAR